jgi:hypothetical protein
VAINRMLTREHEISAQEEAAYATDPGAAAAGDSFKHQSGLDAVKRVIARVDRDQDKDYQSASVITTQKGRESTTVQIQGDLIPSGNATTPTVPDMDKFWKALLGQVHTATAHTVTVAGSLGTNLKLAVGGVAATGVQAGDMIAVDVDSTYGYEVRQVTALVGGGTPDDVTLDRALSANPAVGRTVKLGTTFKLLHTSALSLYLKRWLAGATLRYAAPGVIINEGEVSIDTAQATPVAKVRFSGRGGAETTHAEARPTFTFTGAPLVPSQSIVWLDAGATPRKLVPSGPISLKINNGLELRENTGASLVPTGVKRTGNNSRYNVSLSIGMLLTTGDEDVSAIVASVQSLTAQDVLVQLGKTAGSIFAFRCPKWIPDADGGDRDGEMAVTLGGGRCYGTSGDDEVTVAFI